MSIWSIFFLMVCEELYTVSLENHHFDLGTFIMAFVWFLLYSQLIPGHCRILKNCRFQICVLYTICLSKFLNPKNDAYVNLICLFWKTAKFYSWQKYQMLPIQKVKDEKTLHCKEYYWEGPGLHNINLHF